MGFLTKNFFKKIIFIIFIIFWLPIILNKAPLLREDAAFISFPRIMACARQVSKGVLPLWDDLTFCGARPFYASLDTPVYYLPLYPFMWMAGGKSADTVWYIAYLLPLSLHIIAAFFGVIFLFQMLAGPLSNTDNSLKRGPPDKYAYLCGFIYTFSPVLIYSFRSLTTLFAFTWMPWALIYLLRSVEIKESSHSLNSKSSSVSGTINGAIFFTGLMILSGDLNIAGRCVLFIFVTAFVYEPRSFKRLLLIISGALLIGLPAFIGQAEGLSRISSFGNSINPFGVMSHSLLDVAAWICPAIFGFETSKACFFSSWFFPVGQKIFIPGFFISTFLITGFYFSFKSAPKKKSVVSKKKSASPKKKSVVPKNKSMESQLYSKPWCMAISTGLFIFGALIPSMLLAFFSPGFISRMPSFLLSLIFSPHPIYWLYPAILGAAVISCYGLKMLKKSMDFKPKLKFYFLILFFILTGFVLFSGYRARPYINIDKNAVLNKLPNEYTNVNKVFTYKEWILKGSGVIPIICLALVTITFIVSAFQSSRLYAAGKRKELFKLLNSALFFFFLVEYSIWAYVFLYNSIIYPEVSAKGDYGLLFKKNTVKPFSHDYYRQAQIIINEFEDKSKRFSGINSDIDHLAWVTGIPALTGYDCKPLYQPFVKVLLRAGLMPFYWMNTSLVPKSFLRNMGVRKRYNYSVYPNITKNAVGEKMYYDTNYVKSLNLISNEISKPLDLIYFQNNYEIADLDECIKKTVYSDLGKTVVIEQTEYDKALASADEIKPSLRINPAIESTKNTESTKATKINKFTKITMIESGPGKTVLTVDLRSNGFIVINKCWDKHWVALVNNQTCNLVRLNSFMQGLYLKKGNYKIELSFKHYPVYFGFVISIIMMLCQFIFLLYTLQSSKKVNP